MPEIKNDLKNFNWEIFCLPPCGPEARGGIPILGKSMSVKICLLMQLFSGKVKVRVLRFATIFSKSKLKYHCFVTIYLGLCPRIK